MKINPVSKRRITRAVKVGGVTIGGGAAISVQSMTNVPTCDAGRCLEQITELAGAGCDLVRVAAATKEDTAALKEIVARARVPIVADVHFHYERALEAIEAGVAKIRLNPGNINDRGKVEEIIEACKAKRVAIRVGVNQGSIRQRGKGQRVVESMQDIVELILEKLGEYIEIFETNGFDQLVLSAKCHNAASTIAVNRAISQRYDYPLHLGVTHAGVPWTGAIRSATALGALLAEGIGDTIRVSLAGESRAEVETAEEILISLGLRERRGAEVIACPTCGRTEIDIAEMAEKVQAALRGVRDPITVAVMGCVVNGPGEAAEADIALCGGKDKALIYRSGKRICTVGSGEAFERFMEQIGIFLKESYGRTIP